MAEEERRPVRRVAVVTGAAGGLGAEIACRLAEEGYGIALLDLDGERLVQTRAQVERRRDAGNDDEVLTLGVNLTDEGAVETAFDAIARAYGRIDVLVNVAGGSGTDVVRSLSELSIDIWRKVIDNNLTSAFLCSRFAVPLMEAGGYGRIVNFSSGVANGLGGPSGTVGARLPYAASKGAINSLTKQLAKDLARTGITVNAVSPGLILPAGGRVRDSFEALSAEAKTATSEAIPVGRPGTGQEIAAAVAYLVSEEAGFTTGTVLAVDGAAF